MPNFTDITFDTTDPTHTVNITIYGNVAGSLFADPLPPPNSPQWSDPSFTDGKIADIYNNTQPGGSIKQGETTLISTFKVLTYTPAAPEPIPLCNMTRSGSQCPLAPDFSTMPYRDASNEPYDRLPAFGVSYPMESSFRFATLDTTFTINSGLSLPNGDLRVIGCVSANITPDLGPSLRGMLRYLPMAILILVAITTISAAIFSPWGTTDPFKWTSNYGRDEDTLRLVTPGFGDCLQYIQFIFLSGALSLNYPGFFRPVVSQVNWSALMFNQSFVSHGPPVQNPVDGVYATRYYTQNGLDLTSPANYGMTQIRELTGMSQNQDIWGGAVIWTLVIIAVVIAVCEVGFLTRFVIRAMADRPEEDLRSKNWPFTCGCVVRIVCNFFLLPLVALSFFQLVIAGRTVGGSSTNIGVVVAAVILLVAILGFAGWILKIIFAAKPRSILFELPTVLLWGPLYNTYSDDAAPFALIPALLTFIRAVAIGAVQPSGIAQLVILAICEVILILTLQAFRPFRRQTSMNLYHTFFSTVRLTVVLLSITFTPSLGVTEPAKGWVGYIILLLHAIVLVFGFFLNSLQTLIEVIARYSGAGADDHTGAATRGAFVKVFGMRQLSRRARRPGFRHSMTSDAAILTDDQDAFDNKSGGPGGRSRSISASSAILLNQRTPDRMSSHLDRTESGSGDLDRSTDSNMFSFLPENDRAAAMQRRGFPLKTNDSGQVFYRQPRQRRPTGELMTPGGQTRSRGSGDWANAVVGESGDNTPDKRASTGHQLSISPEGNSKLAPAPAYMRQREGSDPVLNRDSDPAHRADVDYAVREVDFYYGVRGPALSSQPTRKLRTGPADPVGPASSAAGWFRNMFGGKRKESGGKGFEVVRSSRAPPPRFPDDSEPDVFREPYHDTPPSNDSPPAIVPGQRTRSTDEDRELQYMSSQAQRGDDTAYAPSQSEDEDISSTRAQRVSDIAPSIAPLDVGTSSIHMPSRFNSRATTVPSQQPSRNPSNRLGVPAPDSPSSFYSPIIPHKSSRRFSNDQDGHDPARLGPIDSIPERHSYSHGRNLSNASQTGRVPFTTPLSLVEREESHPRVSLGVESMLDFDGRGPSSAVDEDPRHASYGVVSQYRTSDRLTQGSPELGSRLGEAAEVVRDNSRGSERSDDFGRREFPGNYSGGYGRAM